MYYQMFPCTTHNDHIHADIMSRFDNFIERNIVPNILLYGPSGSGKKHLIKQLLLRIYNNDHEIISNNVLYINCINGKGINFVRDELKLFAKTNVNSRHFKSIVLMMIDKLTLDAQSALRRCIELYNHNTRFFAVVHHKQMLIRPLLSRFCDLYVNYPEVNGCRVNMHEHTRFTSSIAVESERDAMAHVAKMMKQTNGDVQWCLTTANQMYDLGISGNDVLSYLKQNGICAYPLHESNAMLIYFQEVIPNIRNERYLLFLLLYTCQIRRTAFLNYINLL